MPIDDLDALAEQEAIQALQGATEQAKQEKIAKDAAMKASPWYKLSSTFADVMNQGREDVGKVPILGPAVNFVGDMGRGALMGDPNGFARKPAAPDVLAPAAGSGVTNAVFSSLGKRLPVAGPILAGALGGLTSDALTSAINNDSPNLEKTAAGAITSLPAAALGGLAGRGRKVEQMLLERERPKQLTDEFLGEVSKNTGISPDALVDPGVTENLKDGSQQLTTVARMTTGKNPRPIDAPRVEKVMSQFILPFYNGTTETMQGPALEAFKDASRGDLAHWFKTNQVGVNRLASILSELDVANDKLIGQLKGMQPTIGKFIPESLLRATGGGAKIVGQLLNWASGGGGQQALMNAEKAFISGNYPDIPGMVGQVMQNPKAFPHSARIMKALMENGDIPQAIYLNGVKALINSMTKEVGNKEGQEKGAGSQPK